MNFFSSMADFLTQQASLLSTLSVLMVAPVISRSKRAKPLRFARYGRTTSKTLGSLTLGSLTRGRFIRRSLTLGCLILGSLTLTGCAGSTYSGHFDCPLGEGARCASLSKVNKMIDRNEIDLGGDVDPRPVSGIKAQKSGIRTAADPYGEIVPYPLSANRQVYIYYGPGSGQDNTQEGR